jgi:hypothetical protein
VALPLGGPRRELSEAVVGAIDLRAARGDEARPPAGLAQAERGPENVMRVQTELPTLDIARRTANNQAEKDVNPPVALCDERHVPPNGRKAVAGRRASVVIRGAYERPKNRGPPGDASKPTAPPPDAAATERFDFRPDAERGPSKVIRAEAPLPVPERPTNGPRGPPISTPERPSPQVIRSDAPLPSLPVFEKPNGQKTYNLPQIRSAARPEKVLVHPDNPEIKVPCRVTLRSELQDVNIEFDVPRFDPIRREILLTAKDAASYGIKGYYPARRELVFDDGSLLEFNEAGFPNALRLPETLMLEFEYEAGQGGRLNPIACRITAPRAPETSAYVRLTP